MNPAHLESELLVRLLRGARWFGAHFELVRGDLSKRGANRLFRIRSLNKRFGSVDDLLRAHARSVHKQILVGDLADQTVDVAEGSSRLLVLHQFALDKGAKNFVRRCGT